MDITILSVLCGEHLAYFYFLPVTNYLFEILKIKIDTFQMCSDR